MDNAAHYGTPLDLRRHALNLRAPGWLALLLLHFNFHRRHHREPNLAWTELPHGADQQPADPALLTAVLRQFRGALPIDAVGRDPLES
jgi:fatty acid desaturase